MMVKLCAGLAATAGPDLADTSHAGPAAVLWPAGEVALAPHLGGG